MVMHRLVQVQQPGLPTRAELLSQGLTHAQVNHEMVRRHEREVIEENFTRWVVAFGCIICMLLPVSLALLMFLIFAYLTERKEDCDAPLKAWFIVVISSIVYNLNINGTSLHQQVIRVVCRYEANGERWESPPRRVHLYHRLTMAFVFVWYCLGLHWVRTSETCRNTAPNLYTATYSFCIFNIIFSIFTTVSTFGLSHLLASLLRHGLLPVTMLQPDRGAPEGTLGMQETVQYDREMLEDSPQCPTCLEDFVKGHQIKRTVCGHFFHEDCLAPWLRMNRTCPLCRTDLARGLESAGQTIGVAQFRREQVERRLPATGVHAEVERRPPATEVHAEAEPRQPITEDRTEELPTEPVRTVVTVNSRSRPQTAGTVVAETTTAEVV